MAVYLSKDVNDYLTDLMHLLYNKDYFGFEDSAVEYVFDLIDDITETLPKRQKKKAPEYFDRYGKKLYYSVFKKNENTSWYVFFQLEDDVYFVRFVGNNHSIAQYL